MPFSYQLVLELTCECSLELFLVRISATLVGLRIDTTVLQTTFILRPESILRQIPTENQ